MWVRNVWRSYLMGRHVLDAVEEGEIPKLRACSSVRILLLLQRLAVAVTRRRRAARRAARSTAAVRQAGRDDLTHLRLLFDIPNRAQLLAGHPLRIFKRVV